jgi:hypothetical protein
MQTRSYVHATTRTRRTYKKDAPHVTISVKNPVTAEQQKHQTSHGYTNGPRSFDVVKVTPSSFIAEDAESEAWPADMATRPKDTFAGEPGLLGPKETFITWPSVETGE